MEDLIKEIQSWPAAKFLTIAGIIVVGISGAISTLILELFKAKWKKSADDKLQDIKGRIDQNNLIVTGILNQQGLTHQKLLDKKIDASQKAWEYILKMQSLLPAVVDMTYTIFQENELNVRFLTSTKSNFGKDIEELPIDKFMDDLEEIAKDYRKLRPFISEKIWLLLYAYTGFIGRSTFILFEGYKKDNIKPWQEDSGIRQIVGTVLNEQEIDYIYNIQVYSYKSLFQLLENKIISEINSLLSADTLAENSLALLKKMDKINELKPKPKAK